MAVSPGKGWSNVIYYLFKTRSYLIKLLLSESLIIIRNNNKGSSMNNGHYVSRNFTIITLVTL